MITFPKTAIADVCSKDTTAKPGFQAVHYTAERQRLEASDGFAAVCINVNKPDDATDEEALIPPKVMKAALKGGMMEIKDGVIRLFDGSQFPVAEGSAFPDPDSLKPQNVQWVASLNVGLLDKVAKALCYESQKEPAISIWRENHGGPLLITRANDYVNSEYGLVMPFCDSVVENIKKVPTFNNLVLAGHTVMINPVKDNDGVTTGVFVSISNGHSGVGKTLDEALIDAYTPKR